MEAQPPRLGPGAVWGSLRGTPDRADGLYCRASLPAEVRAHSWLMAPGLSTRCIFAHSKPMARPVAVQPGTRDSMHSQKAYACHRGPPTSWQQPSGLGRKACFTGEVISTQLSVLRLSASSESSIDVRTGITACACTRVGLPALQPLHSAAKRELLSHYPRPQAEEFEAALRSMPALRRLRRPTAPPLPGRGGGPLSLSARQDQGTREAFGLEVSHG